MARPPAADAAASIPQRLLALLRATVPPVHPAGYPFIGAGLALAAVGRKHHGVRRSGLLAAAACAGFFRHPDRVPPQDPGAVVAPADGTVCLVEAAVPPPELDLGTDPLPRVSIFLSLFDAHVQRAPIGGQVLAVAHRPGRFHSAELPVASAENERTSVVIRTPADQTVVAVQIAGLLARRIVCDLRAGDRVSIGDTYGLIRFGSRLDTYLPAGTDPVVRLGQRAVAGETLLAQLS
ncbi:phosphatidylserine decarboxylase [Mycobacterium koreense]|uniref:Phosphatidylserine decarboxylase proenzyme n=1 Tax=Mycolicibacillus koreensis TaxID=1069220 RepID=A0A7I7SEK2_9MYCO|nr:phosphatidylserine decarboxylase [Mycolicibacillus koreensis]MCV7248404.1 phosphatidylserine decarboxylase [Mycolicibacillus koreensis]ODR11668.1 phosphatidylserine decarboxylase [Mycolicibacillus koreensis]OSC34344.1 phosphatidylserine decarboxylase [Mycolicibacillus koreensis]BBY55344.1 phosphatidylserine decarboxylase proenzyme [Mycolicibacillus koreensis]